MTLTFDPVGSLLGLSLIHTASLDEIGPSVLEILEIFQNDLDPRVTLTFDPVGSLLGPSLIHVPSWDEIRPRVSEIQKCDLWPQ